MFGLGHCPNCRCHNHGIPPPVSSFLRSALASPSPIRRIYGELGAWLQGKRLRTPWHGLLMQCNAKNGRDRVGASPIPQAGVDYWVGLFEAITVTGVSR